MFRVTISIVTIIALVLLSSSIMASSISMKLSGAGAVNDSTIKMGEKVSIDLYFINDAEYRFLSLGFSFTSPDIKTVVHPADSGNGKNPHGDVKAFGNFADLSVWDMGGLHVVESDWDGQMPELLGFGGLCIHQIYPPHESEKKISIDLIFNEPGTIVIDSSFFPPLGEWLFSSPEHQPKWGGPYKFTVVE